MSSHDAISLVHGAPGDAMCSIGHILQDPQFNGRFLYYGRDQSVAPFIRAQKFCKEVIEVAPASPEEYLWSIKSLCIFPKHHPQRQEMVDVIAARAGINRDLVAQRQVSAEMKHSMEPVIWKTTDLPQDAEEWADSIVIKTDRPNILLHPYSFQSNTIDRHWRYWEQALEWFAAQSGSYNFYLTGIGWKYNGKAGGIMNLLGQTASNNHVLAVQKRCDLTVATSCNLSHWATCIDKPIINGLNKAVTDSRWYFRKAYNFPGAMFVENHEQFKKMRSLFIDFFKAQLPSR